MKYNNPPKKSKLKYLANASDFQIVALCEFYLLVDNPKFKRFQQGSYLGRKRNEWLEKEFPETPMGDRLNFELDIKKIIPCIKAKVFDDYADKNHLHVFIDNLTPLEIDQIEKIKKEISDEWDKQFRQYEGTTTDFKDGKAIDRKVVWEWDDSINEYCEK